MNEKLGLVYLRQRLKLKMSEEVLFKSILSHTSVKTQTILFNPENASKITPSGNVYLI